MSEARRTRRTRAGTSPSGTVPSGTTSAGTAPAATGSGWGRVLVAVYAVFALAATGRSSVQVATKFDEAPLPYSLTVVAALVYVVATAALASSRPGARRVAWAALGVELTGVLVVGVLTLVEPSWFPDDTVWSRFGAGYGWLPLVLPVAGLAWLRHTRGDTRTDTRTGTRPGSGTASSEVPHTDGR